MPKEARLTIRLPAELKTRLEKAAQQLNLTETIIVGACVSALVDKIEKEGNLTLPVVIERKNDPLDDPATASNAPASDSRIIAPRSRGVSYSRATPSNILLNEP